MRYVPVGVMLFALMAPLLVGCSEGETSDTCMCEGDEHCVAGRCVPITDAGPPRDAEPTDSGQEPRDAGPDDDAGADAGTPDAGGPCDGRPCGLWALPTGARRWMRYPLDGDSSPFAPTRPVRGAFAKGDGELAWILTDNTYHHLRVSDRSWVATGLLSEHFPEVDGRTIRSASSRPRDTATELFYVIRVAGVSPTTGAYDIGVIYVYDTTSGSITFHSETIGAAWSGPMAPPGTALVATWVDYESSDGWVSGSPADICGASATSIEAYAAHLTRTTVHLNEITHCREFFRTAPYPTFTPFGYPNAPPGMQIGGAFRLFGLFVVAGD